MMYSGTAIRVEKLPSGTAHVIFDLEGSSVNKFNQLTLNELGEATALIAQSDATAAIFSSAKTTFIVGADITEFTAMFAQSDAEIMEWVKKANAVFNGIEDLPFPTVSTVNGIALGGGMEMALSTDYRIGTERAVVGFPEVKLGILPGFGGTVRTPRLIGADNANQWISSGAHIKAKQAFAEGALDAIVEDGNLLEAAESLLQQAIENKLDYKAVRSTKMSPLTLTPIEMGVAYQTAMGMVAAAAGPNYPAPTTAVKAMEKNAPLARDEALQIEHEAFVKLAKTTVAGNLVQMFLNDQFLAGKAKKHMSSASDVKSAAVLGAGIMGGGIAYQSALKGTPILMKDIAQEGIDLGMSEATKLLEKRVARGKMDAKTMYSVLSAISPTLSYDDIDEADIVVEAVVENPSVKKSVLKELEEKVSDDTIIVTNTSTISVDELATALSRPEKFCGMHFFNPVPVMPLVEVIRGKDSSEQTIATTVAYAKKMGKTPIVVNNCPGFLVNRILFPYFGAFSKLIHDGADFRQIDKVMEKFGWPMGPAYLLDVVGIDTGVHAQGVMAAGFSRMAIEFKSVIDALYERGNYGQKTGSGFYLYEMDKRGKPKKLPSPEIDEVISSVQAESRTFDDEEIVERMMTMLCLETVRCLEDGIVGSAIEADMGLVLGIGFPPFRGGALKYIDTMGVAKFCEIADKYAHLGELYKPTEQLRAMAANNETYYQS